MQAKSRFIARRGNAAVVRLRESTEVARSRAQGDKVMTRLRSLFCGLVCALSIWLGTGAPPALAADKVTLRLHHFSSPRSIESIVIMNALAEALKRDSGGSLELQIFPGMQLGGKPTDLIDQALNGVVDMIYTLPGYHSGRFTILEGLELPFIGTKQVGSGAAAMSEAAWEFIQKYGMREFKGLKLISLNAIDPGFIQTAKKPVRKMEDMKGLKIRVASRYIGIAVQAFGGVPVQMPLPAVYEAMARGQVQGMMMTWVITIPFKLQDVTQYYTELPAYTSMLLVVMNENSYNKLSPAHKAVIDKNIGPKIARSYGKAWDDAAEGARQAAIKKGKEIIRLDTQEEARWRAAAQKAHERWISEMDGKGLPGKTMFEDLQAIVKKHGA